MGRRGIGGLEMGVTRERSISRGGARLYSGGIRVGGVRRECHRVTAGGAAPRVRVAWSFEFRQEKL